jgi:phosphoribosylaminoimidazolecarboxamide formyltransferase/IMP cyclohydrolase
MKRALLSTSDKTHLDLLAHTLRHHEIEIIASGGTATHLIHAGCNITPLSEYTGHPEILEGRVKTLHPRIYGGILARRHQPADHHILEQLKIPMIDLVVVNLYPFTQMVSQYPEDFERHIENIDIGGPTLIRAAAKNFQDVLVLVDPNDYSWLIETLNAQNPMTVEDRKRFAAKAFAYTADYEQAIAHYFHITQAQVLPGPSSSLSAFPPKIHLHYHKHHTLRYGENPHQAASVYIPADTVNSTVDPNVHLTAQATLATVTPLQGKAMSYNNFVDADAALSCIQHFDHTVACAIIKHATPCGIAIASTAIEAYQKAYQADPRASFGGIIALNRPVDQALAQLIIQQHYIEILIAPAFDTGAQLILAEKPNIRVIALHPSKQDTVNIQSIDGGLLIQTTPSGALPTSPRCVTYRPVSFMLQAELDFAWEVVKHVKSNAVVIAQHGQTLGIGSGQTSRIGSLEIAIRNAQSYGHPLKGSVLASDGFIPFPDSIQLAAQYGITAIIQPGGSKNDPLVIAEANTKQIAMVFTDERQFSH